MISLFLILCLSISLFAFVTGSKEAKKAKPSKNTLENYQGILCLFVFFTFVFLVWDVNLVTKIGTAHMIDSQILMYEEENSKIEESINLAVQNYMDYESTTFTALKDEDLISLVSLFPELKSDTLVQKQIEVYLSNNAQIKGLKKEKIDLSKAKWNLYFGR